MQSAATDKLLKPPRGGGKSKEKSVFRSAERCLRSLSRQISAIPMKSLEEDMLFISRSDRLLGESPTHFVALVGSVRILQKFVDAYTRQLFRGR